MKRFAFIDRKDHSVVGINISDVNIGTILSIDFGRYGFKIRF